MLSRLVADSVEMLDTSRFVKPLQEENIELIIVAFFVLNPLTSRLVRDDQPENMLYIDVTFSVLKWVTSRLFSLLQ